MGYGEQNKLLLNLFFVNFRTVNSFIICLSLCFNLSLSLFTYFKSVQLRKGLVRDIQVYLHQTDIRVHLASEYGNQKTMEGAWNSW